MRKRIYFVLKLIPEAIHKSNLISVFVHIYI